MKARFMRTLLLLFVFTLGYVSDIGAQDVDSTDIIFNDSIVHNYYLTFYKEDWAATLKYNKEENDEEYMPARFTCVTSGGDSIVLDSIGVRYKGNSTYTEARDMPKKSYKFKFDEYIDQTFFGCDKINLNNCFADPSYMREKLGYDVIRHYLPTPRVAFATLTINDTLIGIYSQVEQVNKGFLRRYFDDEDGNLYKASDHGSPLDYKGPNQSDYEEIYELKTNEEENDWSRFINFLRILDQSTNEEFVSAISNVFDLDGALYHLAWTMVLSHFDSYTGSGRNYYLYDDPSTGKFSLIPWDVNMAFGQFPNGWDVIENNPVQIANLVVRPLNRRILENDSLKHVYLGYIKEMIGGPASTATISAEADRIKSIINSAVAAEPVESKFYSYEMFNTNVDSNVTIGSGLGATTIYGIKTFSAERNTRLTAMVAAGVKEKPIRKNIATHDMYCSFNAKSSQIKFTIDRYVTDEFEMFLYNSHGCVLSKENVFIDGTASISTRGLAAGVYIVKLNGNTDSYTAQVMITR